MRQKEIEKIVEAAENLQDASGPLIVAIDAVEDETARKVLRKKYADLIADIEEKFVFDLRYGPKTS